ncbi:MAG: hypothetical protein ACOY90_19330 [Candidatus Zhuqueibacterota bacterium]
MKKQFPKVISVEPLPEFECAFQQNDQGWIGGDLAFSMPLTNDQNLWLFGDSFIQRAPAQKNRVDAVIISNSIAIQTGDFSARDFRLQFFWPMKQKSPLALFDDTSVPGRVWPFSSVLLGSTLFVLAVRIVQTNINDAFGFKLVGNLIYEIDNPFDPPEKWHLKIHELPWRQDLGTFGSNILIDHGYVYIYGFQKTTPVITDPPNLVIARMDLQGKFNFVGMHHWQFRDGINQRWTGNRNEISPVFENSNTEFSVTYLREFGAYILVANSGKDGKHITVRFADTPYGPFSEPTIIYNCPEVDWSPLYFCYAVKAHPELSRAHDELIITYVTNSKTLQTCVDDLRIYFPRFLKLKLA